MINLVVSDLKKNFGGLHVLKGVSFEINGPEPVSYTHLTLPTKA